MNTATYIYIYINITRKVSISKKTWGVILARATPSHCRKRPEINANPYGRLGVIVLSSVGSVALVLSQALTEILQWYVHAYLMNRTTWGIFPSGYKD